MRICRNDNRSTALIAGFLYRVSRADIPDPKSVRDRVSPIRR